MTESKLQISIANGSQQVMGEVGTSIQNNYINQPVEPDPSDRLVVVLGAGMDAALGMDTMQSVLPNIARYLETERGDEEDKMLRNTIKNVRFKFDTFVEKQMNKLVRELDDDTESVCRKVQNEIDNNPSLNETDRKLGRIIVSIFKKIADIKMQATIDTETQQLIEEVLETTVTEETLIDFSTVTYTPTYHEVISHILRQSIEQNQSAVLRHVYHNMFDLERLLADYFFGFFTHQSSPIRTYLYIAWTMWAYFVREEQRVTPAFSASPLWRELSEKPCRLISLNYTTFAQQTKADAIYFNGCLSNHLDVENKNVLDFGAPISEFSPFDFFKHTLPQELSFEPGEERLPMPDFIPHLKIKPVISNRYVEVWHRAGAAMRRANDIVLLGCSLSSADDFFSEMLCANPQARITFVNNDIDALVPNVCQLFQLNPRRRSVLLRNGRKCYIYNNRIHLVEADLGSMKSLNEVING